MRIFIAIETSAGQKEKLAEFQSALQKCGVDLKIVEKENLHLTLRFLGEINETELETVKNGLQFALSSVSRSARDAVSGSQPFNMHLKGTGAFPSLNHINIIWAGVSTGESELKSLAKKINSEIHVGKTDEREFSCHITVGRVKSAKNKEQLLKVLKEFSNFDFGETIVKEIKLKESKLSPQGPAYKDLAVIALR